MKTNKAIKFLLLLVVNIILTANLFAANYYFSSSIGNDAYTTMQARNTATPWQTTTKLNAVMSTLLQGDSVLFKCGDTFYGSINISIYGTLAMPIVFSSYGVGAKPIITGLTTLSGWISTGTNLWEASCANCSDEVNVLLLYDSIKAVGRYPNYNSPNKGYLNFESHIDSTQIIDNQLFNTPNWTGGEVVIRKNHWIIDRHLITLHNNNNLKFNNISGYHPIDNWGYFIQNHPLTLDQHGEWNYNPTTKKVLG
jgi:hypothetical protein